MYGLRPSAQWPRVVAVSLIGFGVANCSDTGRFSDYFTTKSAQNETTGSVPQHSPSNRVESRPLPHVAGAAPDGTSGGGRGMGSYHPGAANGDITGSLPPAAPPPPKWTWEGGTPVTVAPGDSIESIARRHGVPPNAIIQANNLSGPTAIYPGQHLVIPRYANGAPAVLSAPGTRVASNLPSGPIGAPKSAIAPKGGVHVVAPGETLNSISRLYGKPVLVLASANNIAPNTLLKVGERIIIPGVRPIAAPTQPPSRAEAPPPMVSSPKVATAESPHSARVVTPAPPPQETPTKAAEPVGSGMPSFRWPVRGRVIAGFGPKPNGLQNDGIDVSVPEGTPVKAAEDGVIAYAGNELKGYGNLVLVRHSNGFVTAYAHASEILVKRGDQVKRGQVIARSGQTGNVSSPQLHFEIRKGANPVDPTQYLSGA
jgi:murein DD-endopeptidase MepM/ murein hydrolase activator NlpD